MMKRVIQGLGMACALFVGAQFVPSATMAATANAPGFDNPACQLRTVMRGLWDDHTSYTHEYIVSALADLPDLKVVTDRLLQNQVDIGNALKPYYGDAAGNQLTVLLRDHILIAADVVAAAKAGDQQTLTTANQKWMANADAIAAFLSKANPNWTEQNLRDMLYKHLELLTTQVKARIGKDWAADIKASDEGTAHMRDFADTLAAGIINQFPDKFR